MKKIFLLVFSVTVAAGCSGNNRPPVPAPPSAGPELRFSQPKESKAKPVARRRNRAAEKIFIPDTQIIH